MRTFRRWFITICLVLIGATVTSAQNYAQDAEWLIDALELKENSTIADIGAGEGELTQILARHLGRDGRIYSTELGTESVQELRAAVDTASASNITVLEGGPDQTNLPEQCCDALVMRRVYHHIENPDAMNRSLWESLKPGGHLAVIDFEPRGSESEDPEGRSSGSQHGVTNETVAEELERAGFSIISSEQPSGRDIYVVAQRPAEQ